MLKPFDKPIYTTRPVLPDINKVNLRLIEVWESQWLTNMGKQHEYLENELKKVLKVKSLSLFNNGTIALMVACKSLEISGEVITTPFTFAATPHALNWAGLEPKFCDIDEQTLNINPQKIEELITVNTKAILGVHVFGIPCAVKEIDDIAKKYDLKVIYDAAHAFETELEGIGIGNFGDITMFSMHSTKLMHTIEGGILTYKDQELGRKINQLKNFGIDTNSQEQEYDLIGLNGKLNEVQAVIGQEVLKIREIERQKRSKILNLYNERLSKIEGITMVSRGDTSQESFQYFPIRIRDSRVTRNILHNRLQDYNIFTRKYFYPLCSNFNCYKNIDTANPFNLPVANRISEEILCLPYYGGLNDNDINKICDIIENIME